MSEFLQEMHMKRAKKRIHTTYFKIRNRVTGLYNTGPKDRDFKWDFKGHLFRNKKSLHSFLKRYLQGHDKFPREWEIVPVELMVREEMAQNVNSHWEMLHSSIIMDYEDDEKPSLRNVEYQLRLPGV